MGTEKDWIHARHALKLKNALDIQFESPATLRLEGRFCPFLAVFGGSRALAAVWGLAAHQRRLHLGARSHPKPPSVFSSLRSSIATFS